MNFPEFPPLPSLGSSPPPIRCSKRPLDSAPPSSFSSSSISSLQLYYQTFEKQFAHQAIQQEQSEQSIPPLPVPSNCLLSVPSFVSAVPSSDPLPSSDEPLNEFGIPLIKSYSKSKRIIIDQSPTPPPFSSVSSICFPSSSLIIDSSESETEKTKQKQKKKINKTNKINENLTTNQSQQRLESTGFIREKSAKSAKPSLFNPGNSFYEEEENWEQENLQRERNEFKAIKEKIIQKKQEKREKTNYKTTNEITSIESKASVKHSSRRVLSLPHVYSPPVTCDYSIPTPSQLLSLLPSTTDFSTCSYYRKYWYQRQNLFSRFDEGCLVDYIGLYSLTPELTAKHQAERCRCNTIIDAFAGCGGNSIQFAFTCCRVIAIENDPIRLACAKSNAALYGVQDRIEFILGSYIELIPKLKADVVFLAPPWGGIDYQITSNTQVEWTEDGQRKERKLTSRVYDLHHHLQPISGIELYSRSLSITPHIAFSLPKNCDYQQIAALANLKPLKPGEKFHQTEFSYQVNNQSERQGNENNQSDLYDDDGVYYDGKCEIERNFINGKVKMITAYFGELVNQQENKK
jgi:hypothetical protein